MKKIVLITGANGMLAKKISNKLEENYIVRFLTRSKKHDNEYLWDIKNDFIDINGLKDVHTIIHLAGSPIASKRWTSKRKQSIMSSRIESANLIFKKLKKYKITIDTFISASAVGYYGNVNEDVVLTEESPKGEGFLSNVCSQWESAAQQFKTGQVTKRVAIVRIGLILNNSGGILKKMIQPIKYRVGSVIGLGNQYMPWIHIDDLCDLFLFILNNKEVNAVYNGVAPEHITNNEFTNRIAEVLRKSIVLPNVPRFIIKGLFGEMSTLLLNGNKVSSDKIIAKGFKFNYTNINEALINLLRKEKSKLNKY